MQVGLGQLGYKLSAGPEMEKRLGSCVVTARDRVWLLVSWVLGRSVLYVRLQIHVPSVPLADSAT